MKKLFVLPIQVSEWDKLWMFQELLKLYIFFLKDNWTWSKHWECCSIPYLLYQREIGKSWELNKKSFFQFWLWIFESWTFEFYITVIHSWHINATNEKNNEGRILSYRSKQSLKLNIGTFYTNKNLDVVTQIKARSINY